MLIGSPNEMAMTMLIGIDFGKGLAVQLGAVWAFIGTRRGSFRCNM